MTKKSFKTLAAETAFVGFGLLVLFMIVLILTSYIKPLKEDHPKHMAASVFISGGLFHLICEFTKLNEWYSKEYCKLL